MQVIYSTMKKQIRFYVTLFFLFNSVLLYCSINKVVVGAEQPEKYIHLLKDKKVALLGNHTSLIHKKHLLDYLDRKSVV